MKNKKLVIAAIALVAVIAILLGVFFATRPDTTEGSKRYTVTVIHADGTSKEFQYTTEEEYLGAALVAEGLIGADQTEYGLTVHTVDGEKTDFQKDFWSLAVNGEDSMLGASQVPVNDGDSFCWKYTLIGEFDIG